MESPRCEAVGETRKVAIVLRSGAMLVVSWVKRKSLYKPLLARWFVYYFCSEPSQKPKSGLYFSTPHLFFSILECWWDGIIFYIKN
jgi:hypothetical protein